MQNDASVDWIWSGSLEGNFSFLCYAYKTFLCSFETMSAGIAQELQGHALYISSEGC